MNALQDVSQIISEVARHDATVWDTTEVFHTRLAGPFMRMFDLKMQSQMYAAHISTRRSLVV